MTDNLGTEISDNASNAAPETANIQHWLHFRLADRYFAVSVKAVKEVVRCGQVAEVPDSYDHVVGLVNIRGQMAIVVDLRERLRITKTPSGESSRFIVTELLDDTYALLVDQIEGVIRISETDINNNGSTEADVISTIQRAAKTIHLLNLDSILNTEEYIR